MAYKPPPTNAKERLVNGNLIPIARDSQALILFSTDEDTETVVKMVRGIPGIKDCVVYDGANGPYPEGSAGSLCPNMEYGDDGRRVNALFITFADINKGGPDKIFSDAVGTIIARRFWGPPYNQGMQPPYSKLVMTEIKNDQGEDDIQISWSH